jgi:hypothetical protein
MAMLRTAWVLLLPKILANTAAINACMWQISQNITKYLHCDHELHILADLCCEGQKVQWAKRQQIQPVDGFPTGTSLSFPIFAWVVQLRRILRGCRLLHSLTLKCPRLVE